MGALWRDLLEAAGLVAATAGLTLLYGPWALVGAGVAVVVAMEVLDRG
jgi:hypothetical protein